ncbi:undecaprenyl-diphosphate phosphatase [Paenibacillus sp. GP183]|uniref:undecaprenyl-diphosphate phosphatase n=1 Tax=Paenibacillus sp. GP183 TaxID=1882751 RepID=UPI000896267C|nr:undecaprenyl-diphosphate phosphatase [Paenibacillus sp. GP183]SEC10548.1 undecaprenyl-diphosphatase [Paenibacillus sp. GP183]
MSIFQTIIFAIIQGITELFPISSVAHGVITPFVFHWQLDDQFLKEHFLPYVVMLHLGTAVALLIFFRKEWIGIIRSIFQQKQMHARKTLILIVIATIPAALIGLVLEKPLRHIFSNVTLTSIFLIVNGFILYFGEKRKERGTKEIHELKMSQALIVGLFQSLALIPGFSRSGASMTAGFWMGLKHEASARFSMLLATPIILGASIVELPKLRHSNISGLLQISLMGGILSGIFAFISVWILMRWFKKHEINAMRPFAYYCWGIGLIILIASLF